MVLRGSVRPPAVTSVREACEYYEISPLRVNRRLARHRQSDLPVPEIVFTYGFPGGTHYYNRRELHDWIERYIFQFPVANSG